MTTLIIFVFFVSNNDSIYISIYYHSTQRAEADPCMWARGPVNFGWNSVYIYVYILKIVNFKAIASLTVKAFRGHWLSTIISSRSIKILDPPLQTWNSTLCLTAWCRFWQLLSLIIPFSTIELADTFWYFACFHRNRPFLACLVPQKTRKIMFESIW